MNDQQLFDVQQHPHQQTLNPFLTVWLHPKITARYVIEHKSMLYVLLIISIGYPGSVASGLINSRLSHDFPIWAILLLIVILSPIFGIISTGFYAGVIWLTGKLFKGLASYKTLFKAFSLISIPYIALLPIILIWLFTDSTSLFYPEQSESYGFLNVTGILITGILISTVSIWSFVIAVAVVAEAEKFSIWKAFFTILIPAILIFIVSIIIAFLIIIFVAVSIVS